MGNLGLTSFPSQNPRRIQPFDPHPPVHPEAIPGLLTDPSPDSQSLAKNAIAFRDAGNAPVWKELESTNRVDVNNYSPGILYLAKRHRGLEDMKKRYPLKAQAHPLSRTL